MGASAQEIPTKDLLRFEVPSPSQVQEDATQLLLIERRAVAEERFTRNCINALLVMFLFGAFCALWAQHSRRNPWGWFLIGFLFHLFAILLILWLNPRARHKKRYRRVSQYWNPIHF